MQIPDGMTKEEVDEIIDEVSGRFGRLKFGIYDADDIKQEAVLLCIDALERYKPGRPLENFLMVHVKNRLLTLIRDTIGGKNRALLNNPISIDKVNEEFEKSMKYEDKCLDNMIYNETMEKINDLIPIERRMDLIKILGDVKISKTRRLAIIELIGDLFE